MRKLILTFILSSSLMFGDNKFNGVAEIYLEGVGKNIFQVSKVDFNYKKIVYVTGKLEYSGYLDKSISLDKELSYIEAKLDLSEFGNLTSRYSVNNKLSLGYKNGIKIKDFRLEGNINYTKGVNFNLLNSGINLIYKKDNVLVDLGGKLEKDFTKESKLKYIISTNAEYKNNFIEYELKSEYGMHDRLFHFDNKIKYLVREDRTSVKGLLIKPLVEFGINNKNKILSSYLGPGVELEYKINNNLEVGGEVSTNILFNALETYGGVVPILKIGVKYHW